LSPCCHFHFHVFQESSSTHTPHAAVTRHRTHHIANDVNKLYTNPYTLHSTRLTLFDIRFFTTCSYCHNRTTPGLVGTMTRAMGASIRRHAQRFLICGCLYSIVFLLSLEFSAASLYHQVERPSLPTGTSAAAAPPEGYGVEYDNPNSYYTPELSSPRDGNTLISATPPVEQWEEQYDEEEAFQPPKIHLKHMSLALRLTAEWNRRLIEGVSRRLKFWKQGLSTSSPNHQQMFLQQRGGSHPVNVHPSRPWHPPIQVGDSEVQTELTLFHAKSPRAQKQHKEQRRGPARWGPELQPYLEHIVDLLGISQQGSDGVEIPLAMIYLDRACSVETPRSSGIPSCPFCTPRTVHRLSLVALLVASQAAHGGEMDDYFERISSLGIPKAQLQQMVDWMKGALGDPGLLVTVKQMKDWSQTWDSIFYPKQPEPQQEVMKGSTGTLQPTQLMEGYPHPPGQSQIYHPPNPGNRPWGVSNSASPWGVTPPAQQTRPPQQNHQSQQLHADFY
jgi:hypothetical protein